MVNKDVCVKGKGEETAREERRGMREISLSAQYVVFDPWSM